MIQILDRISGRKAGTITVLLSFVLFLSGCSTARNTAASRFYHAGVAKYNTWFNGKQAYDKAVLAQEKAKKDNSTLFIDASKECVKITNNNKLTPENIEHIVQMFADRKDVQYQCRLVGNDVIAEGDYNLSVSSYVEQADTRELVDIAELNAKIEEIVAHENELRMQIDEIIKEL